MNSVSSTFINCWRFIKLNINDVNIIVKCNLFPKLQSVNLVNRTRSLVFEFEYIKLQSQLAFPVLGFIWCSVWVSVIHLSWQLLDYSFITFCDVFLVNINIDDNDTWHRNSPYKMSCFHGHHGIIWMELSEWSYLNGVIWLELFEWRCEWSYLNHHICRPTTRSNIFKFSCEFRHFYEELILDSLPFRLVWDSRSQIWIPNLNNHFLFCFAQWL